MRITIEDTGVDDGLEKIHREIDKVISDHMMSLEQLYGRIEEIEINLEKMHERMNSEERPMGQWDTIEKIEAYIKELDQRLKKFEGPSVDETPNLHIDL